MMFSTERCNLGACQSVSVLLVNLIHIGSSKQLIASSYQPTRAVMEKAYQGHLVSKNSLAINDHS